MVAPATRQAEGPEELLLLALPPIVASVALQVIGVVLREFGDIDASLQNLQNARRQARRSGSRERQSDVLGTLGFTLVLAGRARAGREALNEAVRSSTGQERGRSLLRRGSAFLSLGYHLEALADLNNAITILRAVDDRIWQARALTYRAFSHLALGSVRRAAADLEVAGELFSEAGQELESVDAIAHRGVLAIRLGDLPAALEYFDEAALRFDALGTTDPGLSLNRCEALLAAGLPRDALREADGAIDRLDQIHGQPTMRAELVLMAATSALAAGELSAAATRATEAARLFRKQKRPWWLVHSQLAQLRANLAAGHTSPSMLRSAQRCVEDLAGLRSPELTLGRLTAGRIALSVGDVRTAEAYLSSAAVARGGPGTPLVRAAAWLSHALRAEALGEERRVLHACQRGLDVLEESRGMLGSFELLAQSTAHGAELASIAQRHALLSGESRRLLFWSERWRAVTLAVPPVRPPEDEQLQADLASMREVAMRLSRAREQGLPTSTLQRERQRAERAVRTRALRTLRSEHGVSPARHSERFNAEALLEQLGDDRLLELVDVDGSLQVLVCGSGVVRRFPAGDMTTISREVDFARFALRRLAHGRLAARPKEAVDYLAKTGEALSTILLAAARQHLGEGRVVIVPPGRLHAVPWALLPELREREVSVAPSATTWLRARLTCLTSPSEGAVVLVRGPELPSHGAEVPELAARYASEPDLIVLEHGSATTDRVVRAMEGARLVHIAAHGSFRADSPLFSSLLVDDGALTVYDLQRLIRGPRNVVFSSCESGVAAPVGADEVLGLASSLIPLGTTGIVVSVVPVNDWAAVPMMITLHQGLLKGLGPAAALRDCRRDMSADPVSHATALSFVCLGAD
jgi:tetratricopeptide (TPR) repeat protein